MLQEGGVYPGIRVVEAVRLLRAPSHDTGPAPEALVERVGLTDRSPRAPGASCRGGEQQRLSLALALAGRPEVAFLDEPTAGVDVNGRQTIRADRPRRSPTAAAPSCWPPTSSTRPSGSPTAS